jgi:Na+-transporting NADH:ubiquinone oxidoreductase subunit A
LDIQLPDAPPLAAAPVTHITEEAAITALPEEDFRVEPLVEEDELVAQGAPVLRSRRQPEITVTAPMAGRIAAIELGPGHRLSSMKFFLEPDAGRHEHEVTRAGLDGDAGALRTVLLSAGLWRTFRSRPFGRVPPPAETPSAIFVMALDTRPQAPDAEQAASEAPADFERGLRALPTLAQGPVFLCQPQQDPIRWGRIEGLCVVRSTAVHPWGLAGFQVHNHRPAGIGTPVWDIRAEDVVAVGKLLRTGLLAETQLVSVTGPALREARLVRCQPGADLRALCYGFAHPGAHSILSGSALDGVGARWLRHRDRQVTVIRAHQRRAERHWFLSALSGASRPLPVIPTAAIERALGGALPSIPFLRALSSGDNDTAVRLGALSFVPEEMSLVDYVSCADPSFSDLLGSMLAGVAAEEAA